MGRRIKILRMFLAKRWFLKSRPINHRVRDTFWSKKCIPYELESRVFTCPGHPGGYLTWWSRAGTTCFHVSRPDRGVSNMVVLRWNRVFSRVHATQGVRNMVVLCWNHVFSRVHATQGDI